MGRIERQILMTVCCLAAVSCIVTILLCFYRTVYNRQSLSADMEEVMTETTEPVGEAILSQMTELSEDMLVAKTAQQSGTEVPEEPAVPEEPEREMLPILDVSAKRVSSSQIELCWSDVNDALVDSYVIEKYDNRKAASDTEWQPVGEVKSGETVSENSYRFTDSLLSTEPQQYVYRVIPKTADDAKHYALESGHVLCSNLYICIDPGHYAGKNAVEGELSYGYAEGDFTLLVSLELSDILQQKYGIATCLTRNSGSITLSGYTDEVLDSAHISLRGSYAAKMGCDLFVSVHTNSNQDDVNGAATFEQPIAINKPIVIANDLAVSSDQVLSLCNSIGENLAKTNYELGIAAYREFIPASRETVREWTDDYNDSTQEQGTVVCRHGSSGQYYGVLRGAQNSGIPGIIVEHGFHSVPQVREAAMTGNLKSLWAEDDADGIAAGYGFQEME